MPQFPVELTLEGDTNLVTPALYHPYIASPKVEQFSS